MWPDLGKYAFAVLASYGVTIFAIFALLITSVKRHAKIKESIDRLDKKGK